MGKELTDVPIIIQYNKRDIPDAMPVEELEAELNPNQFPSIEAVAPRGEGVFPTLKKLAQAWCSRPSTRAGFATARSRAHRVRPPRSADGDTPQVVAASAAAVAASASSASA